jgi:hypothetical protein
MPKQKVWRNPNKQELVTGHKTFDQQLTAVSSGQVLSSVQTSFCIRPRNETEGPMGLTYQPGHLQQFDLQHFPRMPYEIRRYVEQATATDALLVHEFFTTRAARGETIIGYILVRYRAHPATILAVIPARGLVSSVKVLQAVAPYLVDLEERAELPLMYLR